MPRRGQPLYKAYFILIPRCPLFVGSTINNYNLLISPIQLPLIILDMSLPPMH